MKHYRPPIALQAIEDPSVRNRFEAKLRRAHVAHGMWLWAGAVNSKGYGMFRLNGLVLCAHRVAYALYIGEVSDGMTIHHTSRCQLDCNPDHLQILTNLENTVDGNNHRGCFEPRLGPCPFCDHYVYETTSGHWQCLRCPATFSTNPGVPDDDIPI